MKTLTPGILVDKKYAIEKPLGEGGMGVVWLARDCNTDVLVVVKAIRAEYAHRKDFRDRILAEGRALARIDHPNVVHLNAVVSDDDGLCLVMQFIEGETLEARLERCKATKTSLTVKEALVIFRQIVGGVGAAHAEGIIHRDLKPANVLLRKKDGVVKVTDFGIAKEEQDAQQGKGHTVGVIGSVKYLSPEQCTGHKDLDKRVDIYALGMLLFELLTGDAPFDGASHYEIMRQHVDAPVPSLVQKRADVPAWVEAILRRCAAKKRDDRFGSCEEILAALDAEGAGVSGRTEPAAPLGFVPAKSITSTEAAPALGMAPTTTTQAASITKPDMAPAKGKGAAVAVTVVLAALAGVAIAFSMGLLGPAKETRQNQEAHEEKPAAAASAAPVAQAAAKNPVAGLVGGWKSESGREYDAVMVGDALEMRIRDGKPFAQQGYEVGEARFILRALPGQTEVFAVEDRLRPNPPAGSEYDVALARGTCVFPYTEVAKNPLEARLEGGKLRVMMAFMKPTAANFTSQGKRVTGCKALAGAAVEPLESVLGKN